MGAELNFLNKDTHVMFAMRTWKKSKKDLLDTNTNCNTAHAEKVSNLKKVLFFVFNLETQQLSEMKEKLTPRTSELKSIWSTKDIWHFKAKSHRSRLQTSFYRS